MKITILNWCGWLFLLFSYTAQAQFECESLDSPMMLKNNDSKMISNTCSSVEGRCVGKIIWENGAIYKGEIIQGKMNGNGVLKFPQKYIYKGAFQNGKKHGGGKIIYENGDQYDGEWKYDKKEGYGIYIFSCGYEYLGNFKNDKMNGEGAIRLSETESFKGVWKNGKIEGWGTHFKSDGSVFSGFFENGEKQGEGMVVWESGDTMRGNWTNGMIDQESHFQFSDGSAIIHFWEKGKLKDKVVYVQPSGLTLSGTSNFLANLATQNSIGDSESLEANFSLAWYAAAMEYKNQQNYEGANEQLKFAQFFQNPFEDSPIAELVTQELEDVALKKEAIGVARKEKENNGF